MKRLALIAVLSFAIAAHARSLMTQKEAFATAFPAPLTFSRQTFFLKPEQIAQVKHESGAEAVEPLVIRYAASNGSFAYFDTHRVRTEPEVVMVVVDAAGKVSRVDILSFDEPTDYMPKRRWIDQLLGRKLDDDLALNRAIRPISGASLTGRAIVNATRRILAIHGVIR
jgi:hypothetical protein